ncbi:NAD(P)/FAD-dependent oxidoreductase [Pendulispora albinea]|uniref:FAD-dependent oxidoreductase n=1 Tax=Pendulispora albinea TaxID=2741071 RepID=A0ABZ2MB55_9BACT
MDQERERPTDVVVIGAGIIGLMNALGLAKRGLKVTLIDNYVGQKRSFKVGESLLIFSNMFLRTIGELDEFNATSFPKHGVWFTYGMEGRENFHERPEWGMETSAPAFVKQGFANPLLGRAMMEDVQICRPEAEDVLADKARLHPDITFLDTATVSDAVIDKNGANHTVSWRCKATGKTGAVETRWVIDCSGRNRFLAKRLGHCVEESFLSDGFRTTAVWAQFDDIDDAQFEAFRFTFDNGHETRRDLSTLHLWGDGYWIWVIRLSNGRISVGATYDRRVEPPGDGYKEKFWNIMRRYRIFDGTLREDNLLEFRSYKNVQHATDTFVSEHRYGMVGDAASVIDAYYSQGMSLAFVTSWHIANIVSRDVSEKRLEREYIRRVNDQTHSDWLMMRNMLVSKYTTAARDGRFFFLSHLCDMTVLGSVQQRYQLAKWLSETGGDPSKETPELARGRASLEENLYYSKVWPYRRKPPHEAQAMQRRFQEKLGERARWRVEHGVEAGAIRCLLRPFGSGLFAFWKLPFARGKKFIDISGKSLAKIPKFMLLDGKSADVPKPLRAAPYIVFAIFMFLYVYDWFDTMLSKVLVALGLIGHKFPSNPRVPIG